LAHRSIDACRAAAYEVFYGAPRLDFSWCGYGGGGGSGGGATLKEGWLLAGRRLARCGCRTAAPLPAALWSQRAVPFKGDDSISSFRAFTLKRSTAVARKGKVVIHWLIGESILARLPRK